MDQLAEQSSSSYAAGASLAIASFALYASGSFTTADVKGERRRRRRWSLGIRFNNIHGVSGLFSTLSTCLAIAAQHQVIQMPPILEAATSIFAAVASILTASSGMTIVDQAPKQTVVMERPFKVIPPHRDAFRRTAYSIYYLCARILWNEATKTIDMVLSDSITAKLVGDWIFGGSALCYAIRYFLPHPREMDWANGNTYVFVVPMALGLTADALFQLPILQCHNNTATCWNKDIIDHLDLLYVLLSGLVVAFVFTLAFRGVLGIRKCYWGAALVVHGIVAYLIMKALPFVQMQIFLR